MTHAQCKPHTTTKLHTDARQNVGQVEQLLGRLLDFLTSKTQPPAPSPKPSSRDDLHACLIIFHVRLNYRFVDVRYKSLLQMLQRMWRERCVSRSSLRRETFSHGQQDILRIWEINHTFGRRRWWHTAGTLHGQDRRQHIPGTIITAGLPDTIPPPRASNAATHRTQTKEMNGYTHQPSGKHQL